MNSRSIKGTRSVVGGEGKSTKKPGKAKAAKAKASKGKPMKKGGRKDADA